jgi:hypothetical protein
VGTYYQLRHAVAYLVEALCYKPEGRGVPGNWIFQLTYVSSRTMALGSSLPVTEMSTRNLPGVGVGGKGR